MNASVSTIDRDTDWLARARELTPRLRERAHQHDISGEFVADSYAEMRAAGLFSAAIPESLGGGGASHGELAAVIRELARGCGSTALAFAMHSHPVALNVFKHRRGDEAASGVLGRLAADELIIAGTGANDWLESSGQAQPVEGGYRVSAHKRFVSGSAGAHIFVTSARLESDEGVEVLHFAVPFSADGITVSDNWDTLGMRGTGSHDVLLEQVFVPDTAIVARRPAGVWHPLWDVILPIALPLIVACYVGLAESAVDLALDNLRKRAAPSMAVATGEMLNELEIARLALDDMLRLNDDYGFTPDLSLSNRILTRKALAARAARTAVEKAAEFAGGAAFFRGHPLERIVRDVRAIHFHPLPEKRQQQFSGNLALGLDVAA